MIQNYFKKNKNFTIIRVAFLLCLLIVWILYALFGHQLIEAIYEGRSIGFLNKLIIGQEFNSVKYYIERADRLFSWIILILSIPTFILIFSAVSKFIKEIIVIKLPRSFVLFIEKNNNIIKLHNNELIKIVCLCSLSMFLLFWGFYNNRWSVADQYFFNNHQKDMEGYIIGRIVKSRQDGIFSSGGLTGYVAADTNSSTLYVPSQYDAYRAGLKFDSFKAYKSQIGGQGILFSILDKYIKVPPDIKLKYFYSFSSLFSAIALTFIILWFYREFGFCVSLFVLVSTVLSPWLVVYGRNLWWSIWSFYIPIIACMYFLNREKKMESHRNIYMAIIIFLGVFIKCLMTGYEYITTTLMMMITPFIYYGILDKWNMSMLAKKIGITALSSFFAIFTSVIILCYQVSLDTGSFMNGIKHMVLNLNKRTHGVTTNAPDFYTSNPDFNMTDIVSKYLKGTFIDLDVFNVSYLDLIIIFLLISILIFFLKQTKSFIKYRQQTIAIIAATWFSALAPLSWFVIFKAHSYAHFHMNYIVWYMPFTIFGFALCGLFACRLAKYLR